MDNKGNINIKSYNELNSFIVEKNLHEKLDSLYTDNDLAFFATDMICDGSLEDARQVLDTLLGYGYCEWFANSESLFEGYIPLKNIDDLFEHFADELKDLGIERPEEN